MFKSLLIVSSLVVIFWIPVQAGRRDRRPIELPSDFRHNSNPVNRLIAKRHLHLESPVSEEFELLEQPRGEIEFVETAEPRYAGLVQRPNLRQQHHQQVSVHPPRDLRVAKVVEVSAFHEGSGHYQRIGAFQVQPIEQAPITQVKSKVVSRPRSKSRVEIFHNQEQVSTDPEDFDFPGNQGFFEEEQKSSDRLREQRPNLVQSKNIRIGQLRREPRFGDRVEVIEDHHHLITPQEGLVLASLTTGPAHHHQQSHNLNHHHQPAHLVVDDHHHTHHAFLVGQTPHIAVEVAAVPTAPLVPVSPAIRARPALVS